MKKGMSILAGIALTFAASAALAAVIDPSVNATHKTDAKLRADIAKQVSKYTFCLVKSAAKCEKKGTLSTTECHLDTGVVDFEGTAPGTQAKFQAAIAKCDSKLAFTKKGNDFVGIGCPGDCNSVAPGVQLCADIPAFQATVTAVTASSAKGQLGTLASVIDFLCSLDLGGLPTDEARIACANDNAKLLSKYGQGVFKCQAKCENDFKNSKGNGGPTNDNECVAAGSPPGAFTDCVTAALGKISPGLSPSMPMIFTALNKALNDATTGLYDRFDPTDLGDPSASPCGNCGNATREGAEECDGADAALCPGMCQTDCTCP